MPESALGVGRSGYYGDVCNMTDASQRLATETVRRHGSKVVKATNLAGRETLTDNLHIFTLEQSNDMGQTIKKVKRTTPNIVGATILKVGFKLISGASKNFLDPPPPLAYLEDIKV